jgi:signal transduction histidine kinase
MLMKAAYKLVWLGLYPLLSALNTFAQAPAVKKLREQVCQGPCLHGKGPDTTYVNNLNLLSRSYYGVNADSGFYYARKALQYADSTGYDKGMAESWRMIGNTYEMIGNYQEMLFAYHESRLIAERIGSTAQVAKINMNIALFYRQMGEFDQSLEEIGKDSVLYVANGDSSRLAYTYSHLSDMSMHRRQYDSALAYEQKAIDMAAALKDSLAVSSGLNDRGKILAAMGRYREALAQHRQSMDYFVRTDDKLGQAETLGLLARINLLLKDYSLAINYGSQGLDLARQLNRKKEIRDNSEVLADIYQAKGDDLTALHYYQLYKDYSDSLIQEQIRKHIFALEARYGYERNADSLRQAAARQTALQQHIDKAHSLEISIAIILILSLLVVALLLQRSRAASKRSNKELFDKNAKIEQQKEAMEHQAVQLLLNNQQKDKLFSIIAHDLRGPLNSLKGLLDLLKENRLPESEIRDMIDELRRNVDFSSELVGNLLFWASSQLNGIVVNPICLPMRPLVEGILHLYRKLAGEKHVLLKNDLDPGLMAYADKDMIQVVLRNLVSNSIKFCRPGDTITISARHTGRSVEICVADTGVGIKNDILEKIRRKESITTYGTAKEKGTGLGILLCREFTEANGGGFRIDSEWGKGSCFYFTIPADASSSSINV